METYGWYDKHLWKTAILRYFKATGGMFEESPTFWANVFLIQGTKIQMIAAWGQLGGTRDCNQSDFFLGEMEHETGTSQWLNIIYILTSSLLKPKQRTHQNHSGCINQLMTYSYIPHKPMNSKIRFKNSHDLARIIVGSSTHYIPHNPYMEVSQNGATSSHHPFLDGIFPKPSSYWVSPLVWTPHIIISPY